MSRGASTSLSVASVELHTRSLMMGLVLALACGRSQGSPPLTVSDVVGCYDLRVADWKPRSSGGMDSLRLTTFLPPPRVEFLSQPLHTGGPGKQSFVVQPAPGSRASPHWYASWWLDGDSIRASWSTGFEGVIVTLGRGGERLKGHASPVTDADVLPRPVSEAVATPVPCSEAPAYSFRASQLISRVIRLDRRDSLVLGGPVPDGVRTSSQEGTKELVVHDRAIGPFKGASGLYVTLSRGELIREVRVEFPRGIDGDSLVQALAVALVEAQRREAVLGPDEWTRRHGWSDWTTSVRIGTSDGQATVTLIDRRLR